MFKLTKGVKVFTKLSIVLPCLVAMMPALASNPDAYQCRSRHDLVGPCWTVHGRLHVYNGSPSARIWPVGTHRLLGVQDQFFDGDEESAEPAELRRFGPGAYIYANFFVCPLTKSKPGVMQIVCISGAKHIRVERYLDDSGKSKVAWHKLPDTRKY